MRTCACVRVGKHTCIWACVSVGVSDNKSV